MLRPVTDYSGVRCITLTTILTLRDLLTPRHCLHWLTYGTDAATRFVILGLYYLYL